MDGLLTLSASPQAPFFFSHSSFSFPFLFFSLPPSLLTAGGGGAPVA